MIERLRSWLPVVGELPVGFVVALAVVAFLACLIIMPLLVVRMPHDYFVQSKPREGSWRRRYAAIRYAVLLLKNVVGLVLVIAGLAMLVLPGQGILTILLGVSLMNFPGKRWLELRLIRQRVVRQSIDWIRARYDRPKLVLPSDDERR